MPLMFQESLNHISWYQIYTKRRTIQTAERYRRSACNATWVNSLNNGIKTISMNSFLDWHLNRASRTSSITRINLSFQLISVLTPLSRSSHCSLSENSSRRTVRADRNPIKMQLKVIELHLHCFFSLKTYWKI